ncbi:odorant receptor Or2-like [Schistocerca cancellata]|uniref:odorant receptor Or2-like n=1 Tax=Schistocerca cancellata TaxID=274614 RepID=UPI002117C238|nr:odorant receptor Or2-like [Schistocerca cancellata]
MGHGWEDDLEKSLSWTESGESVLKLNIRHLWLFGLWPLNESWAFHIYTAYGYIIGLWNFIECLLAIYFAWGDMDEVTLVFMAIASNLNGLIKMTFFLYDRRRYNSLARRVGALLSVQRDVCDREPPLAAILRSSQGRAFRLTLSLLLFMFSQCFVWFPMPLIAHPELRRLPFAQHAWDDNKNLYGLSYFAQCAAGLWMTQMSFGMDCLFASVMILLAAQLDILARRVAALRKEAYKEKAEHREKRPTAGFCDKMYDDLCLCVESHQKILSFVTHLQNAMSPVAMTQFAFSVLVICLGLFQATFSEDFSAVFKCASFLPIPCAHVFLYCWAANNVTVQAEAVSAAAYSCSWVEASERFKHAMRILVSRARKPLVLTAGHLYPIDREAFLSLVNASYSYYALLSQMNNR